MLISKFNNQSRTGHIPHVPLIIAGSFLEVRGYHTFRPNGTKDWLLIGTVGGSGRFAHAGGEIVTTKGDLTLIRPGTAHDYSVNDAAGNWNLLWSHFLPRSHWTEWLKWKNNVSGIMTLRLQGTGHEEDIFSLLRQTYETAVSDQPLREAYAMNTLERFLLRCSTLSMQTGKVERDLRVESVINYISGNLAEPASIATLARVSNLSISRIGHIFREQIGVTPQQYWEQQRMIRAQQLLELTGRSIQSIAAEVGYENPYYFSNRFKAFTGQSPTEYRRTHL